MTNKTLKMAIGAALLLPALAFAQVQVVERRGRNDLPRRAEHDHA